MESKQAHSGKAPLLVFIPPTKLAPEKAEPLYPALLELIRQLDPTVTGGEIVGVSLEKTTRAGDVTQAIMTISIRIAESGTT